MQNVFTILFRIGGRLPVFQVFFGQNSEKFTDFVVGVGIQKVKNGLFIATQTDIEPFFKL